LLVSVFMCGLDIAVGLCGGVYGELVVGERGQSEALKDARLNTLGTDIRVMATWWRDVAMCPHKRLSLKKQVWEREREREKERERERERERQRERERETISMQNLKEEQFFINELICCVPFPLFRVYR
jgi:hypothetical protein